jgi:hypothetical protein
MMMNQDCIDVAGLKFARPKLCQSIWSWKPRYHNDIVRRGRKAYRIVEKTGFFSYLAIPYKWHAHR